MGVEAHSEAQRGSNPHLYTGQRYGVSTRHAFLAASTNASDETQGAKRFFEQIP